MPRLGLARRGAAARCARRCATATGCSCATACRARRRPGGGASAARTAAARGQAGAPRASRDGLVGRARQPGRGRRLVVGRGRPGRRRARGGACAGCGRCGVADRRRRPARHRRDEPRVTAWPRDQRRRPADLATRPRLRPAPRRQDGDPLDGPRPRTRPGSRWPTRPASPGSARRSPRPGAGPRLHLGVQHRRRRHRRHRRARPRRHRPAAAMPVMEGKAVLFKQFGGVDAVPICLDTTDVDEIVETVVRLAPTLRRHQPRGHLRAALLRDRAPAQGAARHPGLPRRPARHRGRRPRRAAQRRRAHRPRARRPARRDLRRRRGRRRGRRRSCSRPGVGDLAVADRTGVVHVGRDDLTDVKQALAASTNTSRPHRLARRRAAPAPTSSSASPAAPCPRRRVATHGARRDHLRAGQPRPRGAPRRRRTGTPRVVATGRTDFPNQINNVLAFPGHLPGRASVRAHRDHRGHEARRRRRARRPASATTSPRTSSSRRRSTRGSPRRSPPRSPQAARDDGRRPSLNGRSGSASVAGMFAVYAEPSTPTTRCPASWSGSVPTRTSRTGWTTVDRQGPPRSTTTTSGRCAGRAHARTSCR